MLLYYISLILLIPAILLSLYVSYRVRKVFQNESAVRMQSGMRAEEAARRILDDAGLYRVQIKRTAGTLTDHYNPADNSLYLSASVYGSTSAAAVGVAAHEAGHAVQQNTGYIPLKIRSKLVPVVNIASKLSLPLILIGFLLGAASMYSGIAYWVAIAGVALYGLSTLFALVTLPVEFDASRRAKQVLRGMREVTPDEVASASRMLNAAAMTYVSSFLLSAIYLLRYIGLFSRRR